MSSPQSNEDKQGCARSFLRLFEDISEVINDAVEHKMGKGCTQTEIADRMGVDRAVVTRMMNGTAGTNLRSIASLLYATDCRLKVAMVTCDELNKARTERDHLARVEQLKALYRPSKWVVSECPNSVKHETPSASATKLIFRATAVQQSAN